MDDFSKAMITSASGMRTQATRIRMVTENLANSDTPGYQRKLMTFESQFDRALGAHQVRIDRVFLDQSEPREVFEPGHPLANADGFYQSSNVDMVTEIADAQEARRSYEANLKVFDQTRGMSSRLMEILRR
jgi:flagellar basal-body rod protein FlgC